MSQAIKYFFNFDFMKPPLFSCLESRVANNGSLYGRFLFGPLPIDLSLTVATVLRRSLLHSKATFTIVSAEIEGATHEYASLPGLQESVLEILLNLGEIVLTTTQENFLNSNYRTSIETASFLSAFIRISGPCIVEAKDINWPKGIFCVKPKAYIATLSSNETLAMRIKIACPFSYKKQNKYNIEKTKSSFSTSQYPDSIEKNQLNQSQFDFFKLQKNRKHNPAPIFSNTNENSLPTNTLKLSNSFQIQDYTPLSSYSTRKRNVAQNNTHFQLKTNSNSSNSFYSFHETNNEVADLNVQNIFFSQKQKEEQKTSVTFQSFPNFIDTFNSQKSLNANQEKQSFRESPFFDKNITNNSNLTLPLKESVPLVISSSSYPIEKVNFLIERDDDLIGYRHRIILEVWTNGSISPRQAIFNSIGSIIKLLYSFREPVRHFSNIN